MMAPRICCAIAALLFVLSCIAYRKMHDFAGDRLLFLAYTALALAWVVQNDLAL